MRKFGKLVLPLIICCFTLVGCSLKTNTNSKNVNNNDINIETKTNEISIPTPEEIIAKLCSPEFEGRFTAKKGNKLSEEYINDIFSKLKLEPVFNDSFYHTYIHEDTADNDTRIVIEKKVNNLVGKISGKNNKKALVLSAHFDHIGIQGGKLIPGAVDNASGVTVLINLAKDLKLQSEKAQFNCDIVFASFNGEEIGLGGSKNFVNEIGKYYDDIYNINIDSVGYKDGGNVVLVNSFNKIKKLKNSDTYTTLYKNLEDIFENNNVAISDNYALAGGSDDYSFQEKGYTSIQICDEYIKKIIHTSGDTPENIDYKKLNTVKNCVYDYVIKFCS